MERSGDWVGRLAVKRGFIGEEQLLDVLDLQIHCERLLGLKLRLGELLYIRGHLSIEQLRELVSRIGKPKGESGEIRGRMLFGRIAVERGFATRSQILKALDVQRAEVDGGGPRRHIGQILVEQGILTPEQLGEIVLIQREEKPPPRPG